LVKISVGRVVWIYAIAASWKSVLVRHMACRVTASFRASATLALRGPVLHPPRRLSTALSIHRPGWRCNAGLESLRVTGCGTVTRAVCGVGGSLGRLGGDVTLPADPVICTAAVCGCVADILITKARVRTLAAPSAA
jgi:hypothetical protein